jgi:two-component system, NtrC family, response regulator GlrR
MMDTERAEGRGRAYSTVISRRNAELAPLPLLVRTQFANARPNPARLSEGALVLGAGSDSDVVIDSDTVSRRHAEIRLVPEGARVTDLDSKNGLYFLGQRFQSMVLAPGSRFRIGSAEVELEMDGERFAERRSTEPESYGELVGVSARMRALFARLVGLEGSKVNLLVTGESGTGKELVARAIHAHSPAQNGPLVVVNCGALDRNLVRSELFGHQRGAFTGAVQQQIGAFEAAEGGTLFLDEIGELPLDVQPVLLRALELRAITPVGSHGERPVNVRLVAATHRDLAQAVKDGSFREDLYYRVRVVCLEIPPLRDRLGDVPVLAASIARRLGARALPEDFIAALRAHHWPGNVRELHNAVEAYLAVGAPPPPGTKRRPQLAEALAEFVEADAPYATQKNELLRLFSEAYVKQLLLRTGGNQSQAARLSGLERSYLGRLIDKLGLK